MSNVRAMDPNSVARWSPKIDRDLPENERFTIHYKPLRMREEAEIADNQISQVTKGRTSQYSFLLNKSDVKRLERAIVGWDNLPYPAGHKNAGEVVPFSTENIEMIPPEVRQEVLEDLTGRKKLAETEEEELGEAKAV